MPQPSRAASGLVSAAALIATVTVVARLIGFVRYAILARTVGTGCLGDVYTSANAVPNVVYELVVGGALAAVVVPLIAGRSGPDHESEARQTVAALHGWVLTLLVPVTVLGYLLSAFAVDIFSQSGCAGPKATDTALAMLWIFLLQIPIYGATVVAQGALQSQRRFLAPAVAPAVSSLVVICGYLAYAYSAGDDRGSLETLTGGQLVMLAGGTTAGVIALLLVQLPSLSRAGLVVWPSWRFLPHDAGRVWPLAWSGAVIVGSQWLAFGAAIVWSNRYGEAGNALVFTLGWTLFLLPWSVLVLPIATSVFPQLARLHAEDEHERASRTIALSTRAVVTAAAIGGAGLAAAAEPLARVMLEGAPGPDRVPALAVLLVALAPGVVAYGVHGHAVRVLSAQHRAPVAALGTAVGWVIGLMLAGWGVRGAESDASEVAAALGVGFSTGLVVAACWLLIAIRVTNGASALQRLWRTALPALAGALVSALVLPGLLDDIATSVWASVLWTIAIGLMVSVIVLGAVTVADPSAVREFRRRRSGVTA